MTVTSNKPHFIIVANPATPKSAGISTLWHLADTIEVSGYEVTRLNLLQKSVDEFVVSLDKIHWIPATEGSIRYLTRDIEFPIFISGENIDCKYFQSMNFCRYHLNRMGNLVNKGSIGPDEYHIAFLDFFYPNANFNLILHNIKIDLDEARNLPLDGRSVNLTYFGKAHLYHQKLEPVQGSIVLTRTWPETNEAYQNLMKKARFVFCYDSLTSVINDAILLGAMPVILSHLPFTRDEYIAQFKDLPAYLPYEGQELEKFVSTFPARRQKFLDDEIYLRDSYSLRVQTMCEDIVKFFSKKR